MHAILLCQLKIKNRFQRRFLLTEIREEVKNRVLQIPVHRGSLILGCEGVIQGGKGFHSGGGGCCVFTSILHAAEECSVVLGDTGLYKTFIYTLTL